MPILIEEDLWWQHGPTDVSGMLDIVVNPGDCLEYVYDQVGTSIGTVFSCSRNDGPATVPDGLWKGLHVGCSNPIAVPGCLVKVETFSTATRCDAAMLHHW